MRTKVTKDAFKGQKIFVGLDVHKNDFNVSVMAGGVFYKTFTSPPDGEKIAGFLENNFPGAEYYSAYEAGFSGFWLHKQLKGLGINSIIVNPADIPTTDKERKQKEDRRDSRKLARDLQAGQLQGIYVPTEKTLHDRILIRSRQTIVKEVRRSKQRIKSMLYFQGIKYPEKFAAETNHWSRNFIKWLESIVFENESGKQALQTHIETLKHHRGLLLQTTRQIGAISRSDHYKQHVENLVSIPGIAMLTAMTLLAELETIRRFKNFNHLCSFVGLVPSTDSSGDNDKTTGITPRKNSNLRSALIESAWVAIRSDPALMSTYLNYCKRMASTRAIVRIAKKLLNRIVYVLRKNEKYEKNIIK
jgi:transposase